MPRTVFASLLVRKGEVHYIYISGKMIAYNDPRFRGAIDMFREQTELDPIRLGRQQRRQYPNEERLLIKCTYERRPRGDFKLRDMEVEPVLPGTHNYDLLSRAY